MQGFSPLAPCFIILSNYLHRFAHQASVHWQDVIASAINQETFGGVLRASPPLIQTHWEARLMFILIKSNHSFWHFDIWCQIVLVVFTLIILVTVLFDSMCTEAMPASVLVSLTTRFSISPLEKKALCICDCEASEWCITGAATVVCQGRGAHCVLMTPPINTQLLALSVASSMLYKNQKHVKICPELNTTYSSPQGYYSNLVKALGKSTAPAAAQWEEVAGGGMWMS